MKNIIYACVLISLISMSTLSAKGKISLITAGKVELRQLTKTIPLSATAEPIQSAEISSKIAGLVEGVYVVEGQLLQKGEPILSLDQEIAELDIASAKAKLDEAMVRHKEALRQKNEYQSLVNKKAVSSTTLASSMADAETTKAAIALEKTLLKRQQVILEKHRLTAPFTGVVVEKNIETGEWVKVDSSVIKLVSLNKIRIRAFLPQGYYQKVNLNTKARIVFEGLESIQESTQFYAKPSALIAYAMPQTRSFPLLLELDNKKHLLAPGMSAKVYIELKGAKTKSPVLPRDAIVLKADGQRIVWKIIKKKDKTVVKPVTVRTGRQIKQWVEILDNSLSAGDKVVLLGNENLRPGQVIKIKE